ncbi:ML domain-containing protein [Nocardia sp. NPDC050712]|uniref:ML domain-containing protein n=1 Tax=Nocardia sp. NPDC050712 TaxID=3155518 RepID=UPI0033F7625F
MARTSHTGISLRRAFIGTSAWFTAALVVASAAHAAPHNACPDTESWPIRSVSVSSCAPEASECEMRKGADIHLEIGFHAAEKARKIQASVEALTDGKTVSLPHTDPNVCSVLGCPLRPGTDYTYHTNFYVSPTYPTTKTTLRLKFTDAKGKTLVCTHIPAAFSEPQ